MQNHIYPFTTIQIKNNAPTLWLLHKDRLFLSFKKIFHLEKKQIIPLIEQIKSKCFSFNEKENFLLKVILKTHNNSIQISYEKRELKIESNSIKIKTSPYIKRKSEFLPEIKLYDYEQAYKDLNWCQKELYQDVLYLDERKRITECSMSNLIFYIDDKFITPKASQYFLFGTSIQALINTHKIKEEDILFDQLDLIKHLWTINTRQLKSVNQVDNKKLSISQSLNKQLIEYIDQSNKYYE